MNEETGIRFQASSKKLSIIHRDSLWYLNTAASYHISHDKRFFQNLRKPELGEESPAEGLDSEMVFSSHHRKCRSAVKWGRSQPLERTLYA
ncbi:hypothetical protein AJ78_08631 [Emergomyces pasteurianus Ep9510]|uniref:Uncharacterized protein n=1 Tax=Emergomyces pasteurianus Ep9510 TaxID=1447872 RepID=A0A1J9P371_9EURO|nr:hypothetical protein AJ78_08631 [Emergomyces pasteurianus Ep9510]